MSVKIIRGGIGSEKNRLCIEQIKKVHTETNGERCIMIVPDNYSFETEKQFVDEFGGTGLNGIDVMTPRKMALNFLPAQSIKYLSDSGRRILISRAINEYCENSPESPLIRTMRTSGFAGVMEQLINEMKIYCIEPQTLYDIANKTSNNALKNKLNAAGAVYEKYNEFFAEESYTDSNDDLLRVSEYIKNSDDFNSKLHVWVNHFDELTPQHMLILEALAEKNVDLTIGINYPYEDKYSVYGCMGKIYERLCALKGYEGDYNCKTLYSHVKSPEIRFMLENYNNLRAEYTEETQDISVFTGRDLYAETEHIACEILRLVREENYRYKDIVVMCGDGGSENHIIKAVFDEYGIPYFSDEKINLSDHPIAMQILSVFDIFEDDWSYNSVFRYLRAGFIYNESFEHTDLAEIDRTDNYVLKYGITGKGRWLAEWNFDEEENDAEREINEIKSKLAKPLDALSAKIKKNRTAAEYSKSLFEFLESINMYGGLKNDVLKFRKSGNNDEAQRFSEIWNRIIEVIDQAVVTMGNREMSFAEYGRYIRAGISVCELRMIPSCIDSVCVGSVERSTSAYVKALFVSGAVSGTYPSRISNEGFLSNSDRNTLKENGVEIADNGAERMDMQYYKVYKSIAPVTDKLYFCYHIQNGEGKALRPSGIIGDVRRTFPKVKETDNILADNLDEEYISAPNAAIHKLLINKSRNKAETRDPRWEAVYSWFKRKPEYRGKLSMINKAAEYSRRHARLNYDTAQELFGGETVYSAKRINTYAQCPFSYFMMYGLDARRQETAQIEASDFGVYAHRIIQELCINVEKDADTPSEKAERWRKLTDESRNGCIEEIVNGIKDEIRTKAPSDCEKRLNIIDRVNKTVKESAEVVHKSLKRGKYTTVGYEKEFDKVDLGGVYVQGIVDRIDTYSDGENEYVRIIDYKTGKTEFDIANIYNRVNMQMVIYALAVKKTLGKNAEISGMFYNKVKHDVVKCPEGSEDTAGAEHIKNMKLDGVIFAPKTVDGKFDMEKIYAVDEDARDRKSYKSDFSPVSLKADGSVSAGSVYGTSERDGLLEYVSDSIKEIDSDIKSGKIDVSPYSEDSTKNACTYCEYKAACVFERENAEFRKKSGSKKEIWEHMAEYKGGDGK